MAITRTYIYVTIDAIVRSELKEERSSMRIWKAYKTKKAMSAADRPLTSVRKRFRLIVKEYPSRFVSKECDEGEEKWVLRERWTALSDVTVQREADISS